MFIRIEDDMLEMLRALQDDSVRLGLISNTTPEEVTGWEGWALAPNIDDVVYSCEVGFAKPDRRIYEMTCGRLGLPPASTVFIGDGGDRELPGASEAGLTLSWSLCFVERWPNWETRFSRPGFWRFQQLRSPSDVVRSVVARSCGGDHD